MKMGSDPIFSVKFRSLGGHRPPADHLLTTQLAV
jgi:hypothetical protein